MGLIDIGVSGLRVQQTALAVTGQNITNASTPGYSRQRVEVVPEQAGADGNRFRGAGARVDQITRIADSFVNDQVRSDGSLVAEMTRLSTEIRAVDGLLFSDSHGLDSAFDAFFTALNSANASPDALAERQLVLDSAAALAARFASITGELQRQRDGLTDTLTDATAQINELADSIAEINRRLSSLDRHGISGAANKLLDERDLLLSELGQHVGVQVVPLADNQVSVFIGKGQALVLGANTQQLTVGRNQALVLVGANGVEQPITASVTGGEIGGALRFRSEVLDPAMQRIGRLAQTFVQAINTEHHRGLDLHGRAGRDLFVDINASSSGALRVQREDLGDEPSGSIKVKVDTAATVPLTDYRLSFSDAGDGVYSIRRLSDQTLLVQGRHSGAEQQILFDGIEVTLGASSFAAGQSFRIAPQASGGLDVTVNLTAPEELALAAPARVVTSTANTGTGALELGAVVDAEHPLLGGVELALQPPLLIRFTAPDRYDVLDNSDPTRPQLLDPPVRSQAFHQDAGQLLLPVAAGSTRVYGDADQVGRLQPIGAEGGDNGYDEQILRLTNQATGAVQTIQLPAGASAAEAARLLSQLDVRASAHTDVFVDELVTGADDAAPLLSINGEALAPAPSKAALVAAVNDAEVLQQAGIRARLEDGVVRITSVTGADIELAVRSDDGGAPATGSVIVRGQRGAPVTLRGDEPGTGVRSGGIVDLVLPPDTVLSAEGDGPFRAAPVTHRADIGIEMNLRGRPQAGDEFVVEFNRDGTADNRNGIVLAALQDQALIGEPPATVTEAFAELIQFVGGRARQSATDAQAAEALLAQSTARRESISGVNLDEEAANLIRHEQGYNAAAQVINVARELFDVLIDAVR